MKLVASLIVLCIATALPAASTTQPAADSQDAAAIAPASDVLVLTFDEVDANPSQGWIGAAVQQSLIADLSQMQTLQAAAVRTRTAEIDRALDLARQSGASYVVLGSYQLMEPQLRITGQVVEVSTGRVIGGLKATGSIRDLFALQDTLGTQAKRILNQQTASTEPQAPAAPATEAQPQQQPASTGGVVINIQTAPTAAQQPAYAEDYRGSSLQRAVRRGSVDAYRQTYDNHSYYGSSFTSYWGFPPAVRSGVWPGFLYVNRHHHGHHHHKPPAHCLPRPRPIPGTSVGVIPAWQPPRAAGVPLVP